MRLRNIPRAKERVAQDAAVIQDAIQWRGQWHTVFGNDHPIFIEIGMGKGRFLTELAQREPDQSFIGIEKYASVLLRALEKGTPPPNLRFLCIYAESLCEVFAHNELSGIYLNFSDPWPKDRHAKRRLTAQGFFDRYAQVLSPDGFVAFKTDNRALFDFSLEQAALAGWQAGDITYDLHNSAYAADNIQTEYEERFSSQGNPIYRMVARRPDALHA